MNIRKISIGLLFLILALVIVPGATAYNGFLAAHPTSNPTPEVCGRCHPANGVSCTDCHTNPFTLTINANPTTVTAGTTSSVAFTVTRNNSSQAVDASTVTLTGVATGTGTTSSTGIATISVNATSAGSITATASKTGYTNGIRTLTASAPVVVPVLTTITVSPATASVVSGATQTFTAAPKDQNGNAIVATITWTSSNTTVGTINAAGTFTSAVAGTATIKATNGSVNGTATVTVTAPVVVPVLTTITVSPATASVVSGATQTFTAAPKDQNGNAIVATITWSSSNTTVGTINAAGTFTAAAAGTATIKAANGSVNGTATVTVTAPVVVPVLKTITVSPATASVLVGGTQTFAAAPKDQNGNAIAATITWSSSNTTVGTINAAGTFTAAAAGTATIKAANGSVNGTATVTVTATPPSTGKFSVTFIVTDSLTGKPIRDAKVSLKGKDIKTNNSGIATFTNVAPGTYEYKIEKDGYREIKGKITVACDTTIALNLLNKSHRRTQYTRSHDRE